MGGSVMGDNSKLQNVEQVVTTNQQFFIEKHNGFQAQMGALQLQMKNVHISLQAIVGKLKGCMLTPALTLLATPVKNLHGMYALMRRPFLSPNHFKFFK